LVSNTVSAQTAFDLTQGQTYWTGDMVTVGSTGSPAWANTVFQNNLTCWGWGDPGYCGPNAIERSWGLNFSYGLTNVYQTHDIASSLPYNGTGLLVTGYSFSFNAKNGNWWDDRGLDYLRAYVNFYDPKNTEIYNKEWNLTWIYNWTFFNLQDTFASPYRVTDLGTVKFGLIGQDWNGLAGPYGPEISSLDFKLKYQVDPCYINVFTSASCPGFTEALAKLTAIPSIPNPAQNTSSSLLSTMLAPSQPSTAAMGIVTDTTGLQSNTGINTGIIDHARLSREGSYNAGSSMSTGMSDSASSGFGLSASTIKSPGLTLPGLDPAANSRDLAADILATAILNANNQSQDSSSATGSTGVSNSQLTINQQNFNQQNFNQQVRITTVEQQQSQTTTVDLATAQSRRTFAANDDIVVSANSQSQDSNNSDPTNTVSPTSLTNLTQNKTTSTATTTASEVAAQGSVVNKNVTDNSAAGTGVDINSIAVIPPGFNSYSTVIPDQQFYAQREVYKNQRVVDNTKAARFLNAASEWLHEQMVDQQYNIGRGYNLER
jgi:hypothetical protein